MVFLPHNWYLAINNAASHPVAPHCLGSKGFEVLGVKEAFLKHFPLIESEDWSRGYQEQAEDEV